MRAIQMGSDENVKERITIKNEYTYIYSITAIPASIQ